MGGASSRASVTHSAEAVVPHSKTAARESSKPPPSPKDNPPANVEHKSSARHRKLSKKVAAREQVRPPEEDVAGAGAGKLETFVREGVSNISKTLRDWRMIGTRGSKSAAPVISTEKRRTSNHFNFHHESYLAQTRQEKSSAVDFSLPRHLNSVTKQPPHEYNTLRAPRQSPDNIPPPRKEAYTKDSTAYFHSSKIQNPSYLYSLELKHGSSEHCPYVTNCNDDQVVTMYKARSSALRNPSGETLTRGPSCEWPPPTAKFSRDEYDKVPMFLPAQDIVVQRAEMQPPLDYAMIKPKTIRVNGIEYVRKKSDQPVLKLHRDKSEGRREHVLRQKPERDKEGRSKQERQDERKETEGVQTAENQIPENKTKNLEGRRRNCKEKNVEENHRKQFQLKEKNKMCNVMKVCHDGLKKTGTNEQNKEEKNAQSSELMLTKQYPSKQDIAKEKHLQNNNSKKLEADTVNVQDKNDVAGDAATTKTCDKREMGKNENKTNIFASKDNKKVNNDIVSHGNKEAKEPESKTKGVKKVDDVHTVQKKSIATIERNMLKHCKIQPKPVTVSSTGRLYLPSMKYLPTPIATMHEQAASLSTCASEQSYSRLSRSSPRSSPGRGRTVTPRRFSSEKDGGDKSEAPKTRQPSPPRAVIANEEQRSVKELKTALQQKSDKFAFYGFKPLRQERQEPNKSLQKDAEKDDQGHRIETPSELTQADKPKDNNREIKCNEQVIKNIGYGRRSPSPSPERVVANESSTPLPPNTGATEDVDKRSSHNSTELWHTRSVRSKNRIFEGIIERTGSMVASPHRRGSRHSSPNSQKSDTPFSKAIKSGYRAISAKRIAKVFQVSDTSLTSPQVFTPWDSCMMFKPIPSHSDTTNRRRTHHRYSEPEATLEVFGKKMGSPTWGEDSPSDNEEPPITPRFPRETYLAMQGVGRGGDSRKMMGDCDLEHCNCTTVKKTRGRDGDESTNSYSKLNWEALQDFEKKFRTTHVYRSVAGELCGLRGGTASCRENHGKTSLPQLGQPAPRCYDCGDHLEDGDDETRCCQYGDHLEEAADNSREDDDKLVSTQGSSSGLSAKSGQVLPYKKALRMFEKKTRKIAESAARQWRPQSGRQREKARSKSRGRRTTDEGITKAVERRTPRREVERRTHRTMRRRRDSEDEGSDPHFNRSEQELFRNARLQWLARDRQRRARQPPPIRSVVHMTSPPTAVKGILKKSRTVGSMEDDFRRCRR